MSAVAYIEQIAHARNVHYLHLSAVCLFAYDYLTTFSAETALIWPSPWSAGKVLFLLTRYLAFPEFLFTIYMEFYANEPVNCHNIFAYIIWSIVINIIVSEPVILVIRTWAIWDGRRSIFAALSLTLFTVTAVVSYQMAVYIRESSFVQSPVVSPAIPACVLYTTTRRVGIAWLSWTAFELVIVIMTLIKGVQHCKHRSSNLMTSLYRDGILYFVYMFAVSPANVTIIYTTSAESYIILLAIMHRALHAILSCRIIMNLRNATMSSEIVWTGVPEDSSSFAMQAQNTVMVHDHPNRPHSTA